MSSKDYVVIKDGELYHWKYIKREKVNGEWRYYYDKGSLGKSIKKAVGIEARNAYRDARDAAVAAENAHKEAYAARQKEMAEARVTAEEAKNARDSIPNPYKPKASDAQIALEKGTGGETAKTDNKKAIVKDDSADKVADKQTKEAARAKIQAEAKAAQAERTKAINKANAYSKVADKQAKEAAEANKKNADAAKKSVEAQKKAQEALKKYYKTPLGSLKFLSDKGKELLYKIF